MTSPDTNKKTTLAVGLLQNKTHVANAPKYYNRLEMIIMTYVGLVGMQTGHGHTYVEEYE